MASLLFVSLYPNALEITNRLSRAEIVSDFRRWYNLHQSVWADSVEDIMPLVTANGLAKYYGAQDIFWDLSLQIGDTDKIALVGPNGEGKSTLLRIISGLEEASAGEIHRKRGLRIGYLPQQAKLGGRRTLWQQMEDTFTRLRRMETELRSLERRMTQQGTPVAGYSSLLERFEREGGYAYEARIRQVLAGLGFQQDDFHRPSCQLSGGESTRAFLARLLLEAPDLLLLDEPTNHLDIQAIEWLENWLSGWPSSLVVVAHDRYFLDRVVGQVWDMSFGGLEAYPGNYSDYVQIREHRTRRRLLEYDAQQTFIARTQEFVRRYGAGQRSREARGRATRLARLERLERPRRHRTIHLGIQPSTRSGEQVLASHDLRVGYPGNDLFTCPDLDLRRGESVALLGPNGSGKTTLVRTLLGDMRPLSGDAWLGHNVKVGYLPQHQEDLAPDSTVLEETLSVKELPLEEARTFLGRFLFSGEDVFKRIGDLSGGERSRVALAKLTLRGANFLVLDEPTNHLDIVSREILTDVLARFTGTILFVSHDRALVDRLATQVWVIEERELVARRGNYSDYAEAVRVALVQEVSVSAEPTSSIRDRPRTAERQDRKRLQRAEALEEQIVQVEAQLGDLEVQLNQASQAQLVEDLHRLGQEYELKQGQLQELLDAWGQVST
jgi:ATP-binding cassette subfamily F protein 3